ncbi:MAG: cell division protein ZapA [Bacillota bacterium]|nr:cell division protein ZapA [Bacillota bacterium]
MNIVTVRINGIEYNLKGEEKEEYLHKVAGVVDKKIKSLMDNNPRLNLSSAAVLTAVNAIDDLFKCDQAYKDLCRELEDLEKRECEYKEQIESLKSQLGQLKQINDELVEKINIDNKEVLLKGKDAEIAGLKDSIDELKDTAEKYLSDVNAYKAENKEMKFQLQSARYKIIDLQNKLVENQINLVKVKKMNNPLINNGK